MHRDRTQEGSGPVELCRYVGSLFPWSLVVLVASCAVLTVLTVTYVKPEFVISGILSECSYTGSSTTPHVLCALADRGAMPASCHIGASVPVDGQSCPLKVKQITKSIPTWQACVVVNTIAISIFLTILGRPVVLCMMMASTLFVFCGIITEAEAFAGFGSNGMIALAILFVLSKAVEWSGLFDVVIFSILGGADSVRGAQLRLMPAVAVISAFVNNTPLITMMLPMMLSWAKQRGVDAMKIIMPVAFAASLGGTFTKIGSSTNLVASDYVFDPRLNFKMGFFDLAPVGFVLAMTSIAYTLVFQPLLLKASVQPSNATDGIDVSADSMYTVTWKVMDDSEMVGKSWKARGLHRVPRMRLAAGPRNADSPDEDEPMGSGDSLTVCTDAAGVALLRKIYGLVIAGDAGRNLLLRGTTKLRRRRLFEALLTRQVPDLYKWLLESHGAAAIACRGQGPLEGTVTSPNTILLVDADYAYEAAAMADFAMVKQVPNSTPLRIGRRSDRWRAWAAVVLMLSVVLLSALGLKNSRGLPALPLASMCLWATSILVVFDVVTADEALASINANAWLALCSAFGLGKGMQNSGVADAVAVALVSGAESSGLGLSGIAAGIFFTASLLSNLMSNTATTLMMLPIVERIALEKGIPIKTLVFLVLYGSNCVFATPIGTSTNMVIQAPGGPGAASYSFVDYIRFGAPLQLATLLVGVPATLLVFGME